MILPGHTLSELRWQNRAARTRTALRNKKSGLGTERTKKGRAKAPCRNVTVTSVLSTAAKANGSCKLQGARIYEIPRAKTGRYRSGQTGQTVNLLAYAFAGSNPALPIFSQLGCSVRCPQRRDQIGSKRKSAETADSAAPVCRQRRLASSRLFAGRHHRHAAHHRIRHRRNVRRRRHRRRPAAAARADVPHSQSSAGLPWCGR